MVRIDYQEGDLKARVVEEGDNYYGKKYYIGIKNVGGDYSESEFTHWQIQNIIAVLETMRDLT